MAKGLDYASVGSAQWLSYAKTLNYEFVIRYLSDHTGGKVVTSQEVHDTTVTAKMGLGLVWETESVRPIGWYTYVGDVATLHYYASASDAQAAGAVDGAAAVAQALSVGYLTSKPIYFAIDFDPDYGDPTKRRAYIKAYMNGINSVVALKGRVGVYGGLVTMNLCHDNGLAQWFWQTSSWSSGVKASYIHLWQDRNNDPNFPAYPSAPACDTNSTLQPNIKDFLWMPTVAPVVVTPVDSVPVNAASVVFPSQNITSTSFRWYVTGLGNPFTTKWYKQVRLTTVNTAEPTSGWMSSIPCWQTSESYDIHTTQWSGVCSFPAANPAVAKTFYAWAQGTYNGTWYPIGSGTCSVTLKDGLTSEEIIPTISTDPVETSAPAGFNSLKITGLQNGVDYYFRLKVTKGTEVQWSDSIKLTPRNPLSVGTRVVGRNVIIE